MNMPKSKSIWQWLKYIAFCVKDEFKGNDRLKKLKEIGEKLEFSNKQSAFWRAECNKAYAEFFAADAKGDMAAMRLAQERHALAVERMRGSVNEFREICEKEENGKS